MSVRSLSESLIERYTRGLLQWRWPVLLTAVALVTTAASGATRLKFIDEYRVFFGPDNPQLLAFDAVENTYTKNDNLFFVIEPPSDHGDAFTAETLSIVEYLTEESWRIPFAIRVDSVSNFQYSRAEADDLIVENLVVGAMEKTPSELRAIRNVSLDEPMLRNRLVPPDTGVIGLNVTLQLPRLELDETARAAARGRELAVEIEESHPGYRVRLTGIAMLNNAFQESAIRDMRTLVPLMYGVITLALVLLLRSFTGTIATLTLVGMSVVGALGLAGWAGLALTPPSTASITMIMTLAVADSIHILVTMLKEMRGGLGKFDAIVESLRVNAQPVFLTSLTTMIGFLSMNFSEAPPLNDLGNISATGVCLAWMLSMTLLPALVAILPVRVRLRSVQNVSRMDRLADLVIARRRPLFWGAGVVALVLISLVPLNSLNDQFVNYFDESMAFRQDSDFAAERLSGLYQIDFSLSSGESGGISEPSYLETVDRFAQWYREQSGVVHVAPISDTFRRLNKNMHGDDPDYYTLPPERDLAAQYLLLYEMSLPYGLDLNNQINIDKSATRFSVTLENITSQELISLVEAGEAWLGENAPASMAARGVGPSVMFSYISARNIRSMLTGTLVAVGLIGVTMMLMLRSLRYGTVSFVPNLLPALMAFGLWGLLVGEINLGLSIVSGMCLGIIVDDTVHFLSKYLRARREQHLDAESAVRYAFSTVGAALVVTSVVLAAGFMILSQSSFGFNGGMGKLSTIIIVLALAADLLLLPPLLMFLDRNHKIRAS
ncbi:MAG: RND transporter [Acidobacteria bacterium]|nr:RND transporter [Acidobacteriota bacterium]|tara:strand:- start:3010 stop:5340 length:2331 start_codon:yes stop_codon:yes gene_type:complete